MATYHIGDKMPDFTRPTPFSPELRLYDALQWVEGKTALIFLRYYGCPICQLDLHEYAENYDQFTATGSQLLFVLQSDPKTLAEQITPVTFPYQIICDPEMKLYQELDIRPAASMAKMASFGMIPKIIRASMRKFTHGAYEGNEQQLPAVFVLDREGRITYAHYARHVTDIPSPEALAELMK